MRVFEMRCLDCHEIWEIISSYPPGECRECCSDGVEVTWQARAYD